MASSSHDMRVCAQSYFILLVHVQRISLKGLLFLSPTFLLSGNRGGVDLGEGRYGEGLERVEAGKHAVRP